MIIDIAERLKCLREKSGMTQIQLAKRVHVSRNTVNSWEMSLSNPSSICLAELSKVFGVSTDYLLCLDNSMRIDISGLNEREQEMVIQLVDYFKAYKHTADSTEASNTETED